MKRIFTILCLVVCGWRATGFSLQVGVGVGGTSMASLASLDDVEMTKLFGRLADKYLLLDVPGAGTPGMINCCHGGCDNCDFSHVFDEMSSGRAKWLPLYPDRKIIDGL